MATFHYYQPILSPLVLNNALGERCFKLHESRLVTITDVNEDLDSTIYIPKGFVTNGASIPFAMVLAFIC